MIAHVRALVDSGHGGGEDDGASRPSSCGARRTGQPPAAEDVEFEGAVDRAQVDLEEILAAATAATRIVDQEVDAAQLLERAVHQFHEVFILQDMAFHGDRLHVDGFDLFGRLLCVLQIEIAGP